MTTSGRTFLQIPGPTNIPEPVLAALREGTMNPRGPVFAALVKDLTARLRPLFGTTGGHVFVSAGSGLGAIESALVNTVAPGESVLVLVSGFFGRLASDLARRLGARVELQEVPPGEPSDVAALETRLRADRTHEIRAVLCVHNETSTGVTSDLAAIRHAIDAAGHPALLLVDAVSSLASIEVRMDEWGLDAVAAGSQKGLMCPPGLAVIAVSEKAIAVAERGGSPRGFFDWRGALEAEETGVLPVTAPAPLFLALRAAVTLLEEEGLPNVYRRHARLAEAVRRGVTACDLTTICRVPEAASNSVTGVVLPDGIDPHLVIDEAAARNLLIAGGIPPLDTSTIRIGHMGSLNELEVLATIGGLEQALSAAGVPLLPGAALTAAQGWFALPAQLASRI
ncbi:MAG: aminotransferase class V-fold PLP-dependent enzyme [Candidatus Dormibacteraeota bacterium]|nr:aminotransferase class V-fold PLP-dependent enzyme [Candidatus Dormibacteraeota bacterium]